MRPILVSVAVVALTVASARTATAQAIPNITAAKSAATNAANATNAHTAAMTGAEAKTPARPATPSQARPAGTTKPASQPGKPAEKPADKASAKPTAKPAATPASKPAAAPATPAAGARTPVVEKADAKGDIKPVPAGERGSSTSVATRGAASEMTFVREVYTYPGAGRRDPMLSLLKSGDLRPLLADLKLVTVLYDPTGRNSVAILRDLTTKDQYRVKLGQQLGRMRVAQIQPKQVVFTIEEFGYARQETLALTSDSTRTR